MVGALNVKTAKPLPPELEKFVSASREHGFIIVSFGTNVASLPKAEVDMLAEAFGKLKQRVVWKVKGNHGMTSYIQFVTFCKLGLRQRVGFNNNDNNNNDDDDDDDDDDD